MKEANTLAQKTHTNILDYNYLFSVNLNAYDQLELCVNLTLSLTLTLPLTLTLKINIKIKIKKKI